MLKSRNTKKISFKTNVMTRAPPLALQQRHLPLSVHQQVGVFHLSTQLKFHSVGPFLITVQYKHVSAYP